ncbi:hypothetical protein [Methylocystis bryophila]|nr:hypothetical protein [Methylocystis bryophila]BDV39817.1 hypothetical protein DSM21852_30700 [Methylocystis bryophila]
MQIFTDNLMATAGLDASIARAAIGHVLLFLRDQAPQGRVAKYVEDTPEAQEAVAAAEAAEDGRLTQVIEGVTRFTGQGRADVNVLVGRLLRLGLDGKQIRILIDETLSRAEDLLGVEGVREIRKILPAPPQPPRIVSITDAPQAKRAEGSDRGGQKYWVRETVGVFDDEETLETAVDELDLAGFNGAAISVLATGAKTKGGLGRIFRSVSEIEDSGDAPQTEFVSSDSRVEGTAALIGVPLYIGGAAGVWAVSATGGSLAFALASAVALGGIGAGLGAILALAIHSRHARRVREQLRLGGLVLWVKTPTAESEGRATQILRNLGARDVHVHEVQREWSFGSMPLTHGPYDPFVDLLPDSQAHQRSA